jgi:hypothetical protein
VAFGLLDDLWACFQLLLGLVQHGQGPGVGAGGAFVLPLLVSPFVFYPTYNLWLSSSSQSYILFEVIAFSRAASSGRRCLPKPSRWSKA